VNREETGPLFVRLPNWLGDLVLAWPVVEAAAAAEGGVVFGGPEAFREIVAPRIPSARYVGIDRRSRWASLPEIRSAKPRAALLLTESLSSALLARLSGIPRRVGYAAEGRGLLLTHRVRRAGRARTSPRTAEYRLLGEAADLTVVTGEPVLVPLPSELEAGRHVLERAGSLQGGGYAVLAPGASYGPAKQWAPERFAEVGLELSRRGWASVLVGSGGDRAAVESVARTIGLGGGTPVDLCGRTGLGELIGVLGGAEVVVTNDSGAMHAAAALRRPVVAIFGSTSPVWTSASSPWVENLYAAYPCSPCYRRVCPIGYGCLAAVSARDAIEAVGKVLPP
jgi:heptosyltransferase-2